MARDGVELPEVLIALQVFYFCCARCAKRARYAFLRTYCVHGIQRSSTRNSSGSSQWNDHLSRPHAIRAIAAAPTTTNAITPIFSHSSGVRSSHPIPDCNTATGRWRRGWIGLIGGDPADPVAWAKRACARPCVPTSLPVLTILRTTCTWISTRTAKGCEQKLIVNDLTFLLVCVHWPRCMLWLHSLPSLGGQET